MSKGNWAQAVEWMKEGKKVYCDLWMYMDNPPKYVFLKGNCLLDNKRNGPIQGVISTHLISGEWFIYDDRNEIFDSIGKEIIEAKNVWLYKFGIPNPQIEKVYNLLYSLKNDYLCISKKKLDWLDKLPNSQRWVKGLFYDIVEGNDVFLPVDEKK